jgi:porphobilinogen deaminase
VSRQSLRIGTRKGATALAQTDEIACLLRWRNPDLDVEIIKFQTRGDQDHASKLSNLGGKGEVFVAEIRRAMYGSELHVLGTSDTRLKKLDSGERSRLSAEAERERLWALNGHCDSRIAAYAAIGDGGMELSGSVLDADGDRFIEASRIGRANKPRQLGRAVGLDLLDKGAAELIARAGREEL